MQSGKVGAVVAKRARTKIGDLGTILLFGGILYVAFGDALASPVWVLLAIGTLGGWWFFAMPTKCDVITNRGKPCPNNVRGKFGGCTWHGRDKRDAVFAMFSMRNPGQLLRVAWSAPGMTTTTHPTTGETISVSRRTAYDAFMLLFTIVGAAAGVVGATFTAVV